MALTLPAGSEDEDIGSNHVVVIEPFLDAGYKIGRLEIIGFANFGLPVNEKHEEKTDLELSWNLSFLCHLVRGFQGLVEFDGIHVFGGDRDGFSVVNINPGIKYWVSNKKKLVLGGAARVPLTTDKDFSIGAIFSAFYFY